jgi:lipid-binding SYLF domain-containing protein
MVYEYVVNWSKLLFKLIFAIVVMLLLSCATTPVKGIKFYAQAFKALGGMALIVIIFLLSACASIPVEKRPQVRRDLVNTADSALAEFFAKDPAIEAAFDKAVGYFVGEVSQAMVAVVGAKGSIGVLYDKQKNERSFLSISSFDVGLDAGSSDFKLLVLFKTTEALEKVKKGLWIGGPTTFSGAGTHGDMGTMERKGWKSYVLSKQQGIILGGAFTLSKVEINRELTDMGISDVRLPSKGLADEDTQGKALYEDLNNIVQGSGSF